MITRVVKMRFNETDLQDFLELFSQVKPLIEKQTGCHDVHLLQDADNPQVLFTISHWSQLEDLENYRNSALFQNTWSKTKKLFSHSAEAWSLHSLDIHSQHVK